MSDTPRPTSSQELEATVRRVKEASVRFARLAIGERVALAEEMLRGTYAIAEPMVVAACKAKGHALDSPVAGEEWLSGPVVTLRLLRLMVEALRDIQRHGVPRVDPAQLRTLPDGRLSVRVFPRGGLDQVLLPRHVAEVRLGPGITAQNLPEHQALFYRHPHGGRLCAVLGAGNVNAIPPTDVASKLFVDGTVCILKMNPVNAYLGPLLEKAFQKAVDQGFVAIVYGGAEQGAQLVQHPLVDEVHITGSELTHDLLVWGPPGPAREARKARGQPLLDKPFSSELGNISPVLVVPGPYTEAELSAQAFNLAGAMANNASFNCVSAKLLVTAPGPQRQVLLDRVAGALEKTSPRRPYYPGAEERWESLTEGRPGLRQVGTREGGRLPFALIPGLDARALDEPLFRKEPWCTVLSEVPLSSEDPAEFLEEAVRFVNASVWGTLCATVVVHPKSLQSPEVAAAFQRALHQLRYGTVAVNTWPGAAFGLGSLPWGGHPSVSLADIQSGLGTVHNTYMFDQVEKSILEAPLRTQPVVPWVPGHRTAAQLGRQLVEFEYRPGWLKVPALAAAALRA